MKLYDSIIRDIRYRARATKLRAPLVWFRHRALTPHDVFIASYPRSGNTWIRFLLCETLATVDPGFKEVDLTIPYVGRHGKTPPLSPNNGRLLKTHEHYRKEYKKAVYLVRDPRDVCLSNYVFEEAHSNYLCHTLDRFVKSFVTGEINAFGAWRPHVESWLDSSLTNVGNLLVVRYEDLHTRPEQTVGQILKFIGVAVIPDKIREAVTHNDLARMRKKEDHSREPRESPSARKTSYNGARLVRRGLVEGWREELSEEQSAMIEHHAGDLLVRLGYPRPTSS